jgi:hypothetical protein
LQFGGCLARLLQKNDEKNETADDEEKFHAAPPRCRAPCYREVGDREMTLRGSSTDSEAGSGALLHHLAAEAK